MNNFIGDYVKKLFFLIICFIFIGNSNLSESIITESKHYFKNNFSKRTKKLKKRKNKKFKKKFLTNLKI